MSIRIGTTEFDYVEGEIVLPKWAGEVFVHAGTANAGVQMRPPAGEPFRLRLTRFDPANALEGNRLFSLSQIGVAHNIVTATATYALPPTRLRFLVTDVAIVQAELIAHAAGYRYSTGAFDFSPASRLIADWTFVAVPV